MTVTKLGTAQLGTGAADSTVLADTSVAAGSYTSPNLTIDADGRVTAATSVVLGASALVDNPLQTGRFQQLIKEQGTTSLLAIGMSAPTETNPDISADGSQFASKRYKTTGAGSTTAGVITPAVTRSGYNFDVIFVCSVGNTLTSYRQWVCLTNTTMGGVGTPTTQNVCGFRYDTGVDGTAFWRTVSCDGASGVETNTTSIAVTASAFYTFRIVSVASAGICSALKFYINNLVTPVFTHVTRFPSGSIDLKGEGVIGELSASARRFEFSRFGIMNP